MSGHSPTAETETITTTTASIQWHLSTECRRVLVGSTLKGYARFKEIYGQRLWRLRYTMDDFSPDCVGKISNVPLWLCLTINFKYEISEHSKWGAHNFKSVLIKQIQFWLTSSGIPIKPDNAAQGRRAPITSKTKKTEWNEINDDLCSISNNNKSTYIHTYVRMHCLPKFKRLTFWLRFRANGFVAQSNLKVIQNSCWYRLTLVD